MVLNCKKEKENMKRVKETIDTWDKIIEQTGKAMFPAVLRSYKKMLLDFKVAVK